MKLTVAHSVGDLMKRLGDLTTEERSYLMSQIRTSDTGPELTLRRALWTNGMRYLTATGYKRRYGKHLEGRPDIIFPGRKVVIFVDGCFWHGCPLGCKGVPATNRDFWRKKIDANKKRDQLVSNSLRDAGWRVKRYWEHQIKRLDGLEAIVSEMRALLSPC